MKFLSQPINLAFIATALASGSILLYGTLAKRGGARSVSTLEATQMINRNNAMVLDVRSAEEFTSGSIINARNVPLEAIKERIAELARFKNRPLIVVCASGQRGARAVTQLIAEGFAEVFNLAGGLGAWKEAGLPLAKGVVKEKA